jgi:hypothetical protein
MRQPVEWFYHHVHLGQSAEQLKNFPWWSQSSPTRMTGGQIQEHVREQARHGVKNFLPASLHGSSSYWLWTHTGPMSDRQMFIILAGDSIEKSVVVLATIEVRACF